ncbi:endo-1,4-beta-xylanase xylA, putative (macronuclear) [Tetrahymena thermophila SB210]|uniref:Endo-1,4-beta-xylanase xylA, putative n=1 Tax=Tetrahymena thermophila (strain SB210) TaxID=312017 RepID=Q24HZ8_TETTS|nr:endo-1,4-beta-xylanase xylA, putative [Tetrahymena thermophila SB210]EAS07440.2 endo-1,4-beta-xylanase xylA, putative [Tetrahymena thermophila SB210]|eukprot:XP_001027682.2 endo-1,4-beta-xylanase xylA, putative [Tetrahymena thermophila SB210]
MSRNNLKVQLQQLQDKQTMMLKNDSTIKSELIKSNQKELLMKGQAIQIKNKENMHSQLYLQASTKESSQLLQKKNSQNEQTIHSDIFNTSNNSKIQGVLALKFSNTYTQPLQARGEIQSTVSDVYTLESIETLNTNRSNNNYNQKIVIGEDNKIHSQHISLQNDRNLVQQNRRYSINSNSSFQQHKQQNEYKTIQNKMYNNYALKIESSEERILNACQLNFDDRLSSQQNEEQDPSIYNYNDANNANTKTTHRNQSQDSTFNNNACNRNSPFYFTHNAKENLNFHKKNLNCNQENAQSNLQKGEFLQNVITKNANDELNLKKNTQNQHLTNTFSKQEVCNSNFFSIGENEGERQIVKSTKGIYPKEQKNNQSKTELINTLNFNTETEDKKFQENIFTTNSDMPSIILHKTLKSEASNIFERGFTLNDQPSSKNQMSFINEVEDENTQRSRGTNHKAYQNGNDELINQFNSSQRVLTLNPNQDIHENQNTQNIYSNIPQNIQNEDSSSQHFFYQTNQQCTFQNNIYNTPTLKGRLTENTNNSLDFQENKQEPQINQFTVCNNNPQKSDEYIQKEPKNFEYPSMFDRNSKFYHESEASVCNEMQEIYSANNDKPQLKTLNIPNKVNNPALLSSHATEDNNSFLNSHRNQMPSKLDSESFSGIKNEFAQIEAQQDNRQQIKKQNMQEQVKNTQNNKQEQFLQQYENKRPHFLSQEIQIPIVSDNYFMNKNNEYKGQLNNLTKQNTFSNDCSDEDQFTKNLNSLINNNQENEHLKNNEKCQIVNYQPQMKRDSEEQTQRCISKNNIIQNIEQNNQVFAEYNQEKIKKMNEEIRQKLKQINLNQTTLNSTIQISQTPTTQREQEEKLYNFINSEQSQLADQTQRHRNQSQVSLNQSISQHQGQPNSQQFPQNQGQIQPSSSQKNKQGYSILPISYQINQSQISNEQSKSQSFLNQENQEKCFNTTCSNILQYQDINPNLNKSDTRVQEDSSSQSSIMVDHKNKQQQIQSTQSTLSSGLNKRSMSNSRYEKFECKENTNRTTQNPSPNRFVQLNQSIIPENKDDNNIQKEQKQQKTVKQNPPQLDPNLSYGDDLQINPLDVISPQEKIANCISFQTGQQEDPHMYPSFQQPSSYYNNYPLFANHDTEMEIQNNKILENIDNTSSAKNSFYQQKSEQQNHQLQNDLFQDKNNQKIQNKNTIKNAQLNVSKYLTAAQENFQKNNKINISNLNYTNDAILPPSCSSKNSTGSNQNANHYNAFSYKQFIMNMKKNLDSSLIKETTKKQKQNDSFIKKVQTNKKPIATGNLQNDKNSQNKDFEKLNKLIDQQIQKNVIRPLIKRQRGDKEIVQDQNNCRSKASLSHHTPSTPKYNVNSIPNSQRPVPIEIPSNLDISLQHYISNQYSQKNSTIQSNKSKSKISAKSTSATPKQNKQPVNNQFQAGKPQLKNTNFIMNNNISFNGTPSTSKSNIDRNHSFCIPKDRSLSNNKRDSLNNKRNTSSKSPVSRVACFSNVNTNQNLMIHEDIGFNNDNILNFGLQTGFYTNKNQNLMKRDQSLSFIKHSSKK